MTVKVKCSKSTMLKITGIVLGILGTIVETAERDIAIREAVADYTNNLADYTNDLAALEKKQ